MKRKKIRRPPPTPEQTCGMALRVVRLKLGLTMRQVSQETGIALPTLNSLELGLGRNFNVNMKHLLADYYKLPVLELFPEIREQVDQLLGKGRHIQMFFREEPRKD